MRFQTTQTVPTADTEKVLRALEVALRELSDELQREGHRITLHGLGPSPRARNYRDIATFEVAAATNGSTKIQADVTFQASALLGASGQDVVVRSKLDYAFDQMRIRLGLPEAGHRALEEPLPWQAPEAEGDFAEDSDAAGFHEAQQAENNGIPFMASPVMIEETTAEASETPESTLRPPESAHVEGEHPVTPFSMWAASLRAAKLPPQDSQPPTEEHAEEKEELEPPAPTLTLPAEAHRTNTPIFLAVLLGVLVAAGSVYLYWAGVLSRQNLRFVHPKPVPVAAPQPKPAPPPPTAVEVFPPQPPPPHNEANPKLWLEQWADAMRGRDSDLQASFYADPVARYLDETNVGREALTTFFRSQSEARSNLWTLRLEHVSIDPITGSHVIAHLTKHFMELNDSTDAARGQITDRYVRSRIELRRMDGEWKIVSEQDVTPAGETR